MREEVLPSLDATPARPRRLRHIAGICAVLAVVLILAQGYVFVGLRQLLHPLIGGLDNFDLVCDLICEGVCALLCVEALVLLGGWRVLRVRREDLGLMLRRSWWAMLVPLCLGSLSLWGTLGGGERLLPYWPVQVLLTLALCASIGILEEALFRGLVVGGMLARRGGRRSGVVRAVLVGSVVFGLAHLTFPENDDPLTKAQMVLKFLQAGSLGFYFACLAVRTESPWPSAFVHGFWDFALTLSSTLFVPNLVTEYVATESAEVAQATCAYYVLVIALQLPLVIGGIRMLREAQLPRYGWLPPARPKPGSAQVPPDPSTPAEKDGAPRLPQC